MSESAILLPEHMDSDKTLSSMLAYQGLALKFKLLFGMDLPLIQHDNVKGEIRKIRGTSVKDETLYPFAYVRFSTTGLTPDAHVTRLISKFSSGSSLDPEQDNAFIRKHYTFWSTSNLEFMAEFSSIIECINFIDKFSVVLASKSLTTGISVDGESWNIIVSGDPSLTVPQGMRDDETGPFVYKLQHQLTVQSHIGETRSVPKLNNEGIIDTNITPRNANRIKSRHGDIK